jgi:anti-anti-sigma factor
MDQESDSAERFTVTIGLHEDFIVAHAAGELDYQTAEVLHIQVKPAWQTTQSSTLVVDLSGVTFCDSMGVGALVSLLTQSREHGSNLILSNVPPLLERILMITGLHTAFQMESSVEQAIQTVQKLPRPERSEDARGSR